MLQVVGLLQVIVHTAASKLENWSLSDLAVDNSNSQNLLINEASGDAHKDPPLSEPESNQEDKQTNAESSGSNGNRNVNLYNIFLQLPESDLCNLCSLLGSEGYYFLILISGCVKKLFILLRILTPGAFPFSHVSPGKSFYFFFTADL